MWQRNSPYVRKIPTAVTRWARKFWNSLDRWQKLKDFGGEEERMQWTDKNWQKIFFMFRWPAFLYNRFQMKSNTCTILLSIFISNSVHVSGNYHQENLLYLCVYGWLSGLQTRQPPIHSAKYQCRIDTESSPDDGHIFARNMYRSWNKYTKKQCAPSWLHLKKNADEGWNELTKKENKRVLVKFESFGSSRFILFMIFINSLRT